MPPTRTQTQTQTQTQAQSQEQLALQAHGDIDATAGAGAGAGAGPLSSVANGANGASGPSSGLQPFQCVVCLKRFTRHENLKRHSALHIAAQSGQSFSCAHCPTTFSRLDLRKRHVKRKHPEAAAAASPEPDTSAATTTTISAPPLRLPPLEDILLAPAAAEPLESRGTGPQEINVDLIQSGSAFDQPPSGSSFSSLYVDSSPEDAFGINLLPLEGNPPSNTVAPDALGPSWPSLIRATGIQDGLQVCQFEYDTGPSPPSASAPTPAPDDISSGLSLFFAHAAAFFPFIHQPTFNELTTPEPLLLAMVCIGMQYSDSREKGKATAGNCFRRARRLLESSNGDRDGEMATSASTTAAATTAAVSSQDNLAVVQAYLLLQAYAILYSCGPDTAHGLRMRQRAVELARKGGLMDPLPTKPQVTTDLDALWREFVRSESHKRTLFALYAFDTTCYEILSIPRFLSHLEIKHDMPCCDDLWTLTSSTEWAHRTLVADRSTPPVRYITAVRACLSTSPVPNLSTFDSYGLYLVILFLLSGVREVSGWSTMTGRVCFERFEALHSALSTLEPLVLARASDGPHAFLTEATWRIAMIELLIWSPSHTNGVVEGSLDAALAAATHLGVTQSVVISPNVIESMDPHVSWFLRYLDRTTCSRSEPPWMTVYAFKAALIAWQLARSGSFDAFSKVGIADMDGLLGWTKAVFAKRESSEVGRLIVKSLEELDVV